jgi:hypothetical protein
MLKTHLGMGKTSKKLELIKLLFLERRGRKVFKILHKNNIYKDISEGEQEEFKKITIATL